MKTLLLSLLFAVSAFAQSNELVLCDQQASSHCLTWTIGATLGANYTLSGPISNAAGGLANNGSGVLTWVPYLPLAGGTETGAIRLAGGFGNSIVANIGSNYEADTDPTFLQSSTNCTFTPAWNGGATYALGDIARQGGVNYTSLAGGNLNHVPPNATWWTPACVDDRTRVDWLGLEGVFFRIKGKSTNTIGDYFDWTRFTAASGALPVHQVNFNDSSFNTLIHIDDTAYPLGTYEFTGVVQTSILAGTGQVSADQTKIDYFGMEGNFFRVKGTGATSGDYFDWTRWTSGTNALPPHQVNFNDSSFNTVLHVDASQSAYPQTRWGFTGEIQFGYCADPGTPATCTGFATDIGLARFASNVLEVNTGVPTALGGSLAAVTLQGALINTTTNDGSGYSVQINGGLEVTPTSNANILSKSTANNSVASGYLVSGTWFGGGVTSHTGYWVNGLQVVDASGNWTGGGGLGSGPWTSSGGLIFPTTLGNTVLVGRNTNDGSGALFQVLGGLNASVVAQSPIHRVSNGSDFFDWTNNGLGTHSLNLQDSSPFAIETYRNTTGNPATGTFTLNGNLTITGTCTGCATGAVTSITGTTNQVRVSNPTGNVTLSLPQEIGTTSIPIFQGLLLNEALNDGSGYQLQVVGGIEAKGTGVNILSAGTANNALYASAGGVTAATGYWVGATQIVSSGGQVTGVAPGGAAASFVVRAGGNTAGDTADFDFQSLSGSLLGRFWTTPSNNTMRLKSLGPLILHAGDAGFTANGHYLELDATGLVTMDVGPLYLNRTTSDGSGATLQVAGTISSVGALLNQGNDGSGYTLQANGGIEMTDAGSTRNILSKSSAHNAFAAPSGGIWLGLSATDLTLGTGDVVTTGSLISATGSANASVGSFAAVASSYVALSSSRTNFGTFLPLAFFTNATEQARFLVNGNLLLGTTTDNGQRLQISGALATYSSGLPKFGVDATGNVVAAGYIQAQGGFQASPTQIGVTKTCTVLPTVVGGIITGC